jgi:hypothetical protein
MALAVVNRGLRILALGAVTLHCASAFGAATTAANADRRLAKFQAWRSAAVRVLGARGDANSLATAAVLGFWDWRVQPKTRSSVPPASASSALQRIGQANELAPDNPAIIWLNLQLCAATVGCDRRNIATDLRWVDPDNSAAWMPELADAHKDKDTVEIARVLADMAQGKRFDVYYNGIVLMMFDALVAVRRELPAGVAASDRERLVTLEGAASAEIFPAFAPLTDACRESGSTAERREVCTRIARIMQKGDTVLAQTVGFGMERRLLPPDSPEAKVIAERRQLLEWRLGAANKLDFSMLPWTEASRTRMRIAEMRLLPREEDVCLALLRRHKMALEPTENYR